MLQLSPLWLYNHSNAINIISNISLTSVILWQLFSLYAFDFINSKMMLTHSRFNANWSCFVLRFKYCWFRRKFIINHKFGCCCFQSKLSSVKRGWFEEESKVIQWPPPSWVRPKRITKRCNRHAKQEWTNTKVFVRDATIKWPHPSLPRPRRHKKEHCSPFIRHPGVEAEEGKTFNVEESRPLYWTRTSTAN